MTLVNLSHFITPEKVLLVAVPICVPCFAVYASALMTMVRLNGEPGSENPTHASVLVFIGIAIQKF